MEIKLKSVQNRVELFQKELKMEITVYLYPKCSSCQKALHFLEQTKQSFKILDITKTPPQIDELKKMLEYQKGDIRKLFNTSGILYREMNLSQKIPTMPVQEALALLHTHGMLVKRPFLLGKNFGLLGFKEPLWNEKFKK